jgi:hypothetical protein
MIITIQDIETSLLSNNMNLSPTGSVKARDLEIEFLRHSLMPQKGICMGMVFFSGSSYHHIFMVRPIINKYRPFALIKKTMSQFVGVL